MPATEPPVTVIPEADRPVTGAVNVAVKLTGARLVGEVGPVTVTDGICESLMKVCEIAEPQFQ
jgi:hypothetical protein